MISHLLDISGLIKGSRDVLYQEGQQKVITAAETNMCNVSATPNCWTVEQARGYYDTLQ